MKLFRWIALSHRCLCDPKSLERDFAIISNHIQSPHPGLHVIGLRLPDYSGLAVTARRSYWADSGDATFISH